MKRCTVLVLALSACSDSAPGLPDAAINTPDAPIGSPDASTTPDATPTGTVTVRSNVFGATVQVVVHAPDGQQVEVLTAAADSSVSVDIIQGGAVTVISQPPQAGGSYLGRVRTVLGVKPGDVLRFTDYNFTEPSPTNVAFATVSNSTYQLATSCSSFNYAEASPGSVSISAACGATLDAAVIARDFKSGTSQSAFAPAVTWAGGVDLTAQAYQAHAPSTVAFGPAPSAASTLTNYFDVQQWLGSAFFEPQYENICELTSGVCRTDVDVSQRPESTVLVRGIENRNGSQHEVIARRAVGATIDVTWDENEMPFVMTQPILDTKLRRVVWSQVGSGVIDVSTHSLSIQNDATLGFSRFDWEIVASPGTATEVALPTFSGDVSAFQISLQNGGFVYDGTYANLTGDYDAIRGAVFDSNANAFYAPPLNGSVVLHAGDR